MIYQSNHCQPSAQLLAPSFLEMLSKKLIAKKLHIITPFQFSKGFSQLPTKACSGREKKQKSVAENQLLKIVSHHRSLKKFHNKKMKNGKKIERGKFKTLKILLALENVFFYLQF